MKTTTQLRITVKVCTTFVRTDGDQIDARERTDIYQMLATDATDGKDAIGHVLLHHSSLASKLANPGEFASFYCPEFSDDNGKVWMRNPDVRFFAAS